MNRFYWRVAAVAFFGAGFGLLGGGLGALDTPEAWFSIWIAPLLLGMGLLALRRGDGRMDVRP